MFTLLSGFLYKIKSSRIIQRRDDFTRRTEDLIIDFALHALEVILLNQNVCCFNSFMY